MRIFWLFCALGALLGCRQVSEPSGTAIALFCSTDQGAKTESLTVGEEVAVFAGPEGTEDYFLEAAQFIVGSDGRSLNYGSTVYYPDPKQAVRFLAYFPYHQGTFSVPTDQSTATALKEADLCGAVASSTPVATPVALAFEHLMAKVVITTNKPTAKISFPNAVASGVLHAATAELVLADTRSDIWTDKNELIVPVQPLTRLVLTVSGVEYVFDGSVSLEAGKTTTLNLTLHPNTKTATLSGSSVTDWELAKTEGSPSHAVSNTLTLHWPNYLLQGATPDRIIFTIGGTDYTVASGITYANHTFTVPFASQTLRYPYTISKIDFYQSKNLVQSCRSLLGSMIYKAETSTVGIRDLPLNAIRVGNLWWATGNLVASNAVAGAHGLGGCRIGAPADGGLYFQFGSLIGYKGGNQDNGGTGVSMPQHPLTTDGTYWDGAAVWSWDTDAMVWPNAMTDTPTAWPSKNGSKEGDRTTVVDQWFFNYNVAPYSTAGEDIRSFATVFAGDAGTGDLSTGRYAVWGIGDPCTYYLGGTWRLPTTAEYVEMCNKQGGYKINIGWTAAGGEWVVGSGGYFASKKLFFSASGCRSYLHGLFYYITTHGYGRSSSVYNATSDLYLHFGSDLGTDWVYTQYYTYRSNAYPLRCVSE